MAWYSRVSRDITQIPAAIQYFETELLQAQQSSFQSKQDKALLAQLQRKIQIAQEKVNYQQLLLEKSNILSPTAGVAVIKDKSLIVGKPFKVGDFIEYEGTKGTVKEIQIFNSILTTIDNNRVF